MRAYLVVRYWGLFWFGFATFLQLLQKGPNRGEPLIGGGCQQANLQMRQ
jgi:hypothetical protein